MRPLAAPLSALDEYLDLIAEMIQDFAHSNDIIDTLRGGLKRIADRIGGEEASLFLLEPETGELVCRACCGKTDITGLRLPPGEGIVWRSVSRNTTELVADTQADSDFTGHVDKVTGMITRTILCAPLTVGSERLGVIELINKAGGGTFDQDDRRALQALASSAALAVFSARQAVAMADRQVLKRELDLAADIQRAMLPGEQPGEFPIHGVNLPARSVSGDFFDWVKRPDGQLAFAIADVSGKGMNAALLMAKTSSLFRSLARRLDGPGALLAAINRELAETSKAGMFVTMVAGVLDLATGRVVLANAGHEPPLLYRDGRHSLIEGGKPPLGILPELFADGCPEREIDLSRGALYFCTDGLTEARGPAGPLEAEGVRRLIARHQCRPAPDRLRAMVADVIAEGYALSDDLTMMVVEAPRCGLKLRRQFPALAASLSPIRHAVAEALAPLGCPAATVADLVLAVDEACQNIIRHAYRGASGDIVLELHHDGETLEIRLIDFAPPVDLDLIKSSEPGEPRLNGLGIHFMKSIMDELEFLAPPPEAGNMLRMMKRMPKT